MKPNFIYVLELRKRGTKNKFQPTDLIVFTRKEARSLASELQDRENEFRLR